MVGGTSWLHFRCSQRDTWCSPTLILSSSLWQWGVAKVLEEITQIMRGLEWTFGADGRIRVMMGTEMGVACSSRRVLRGPVAMSCSRCSARLLLRVSH